MKNTLLKLLALLTLVCMLLPMAMAEEVISEPVEAIIAEEEAALTGEEEGVVEFEAANDAMLDYDDEDDDEEDWDEDCEHEYTYTETRIENATYTAKDAYHHYVIGKKVKLTICEDCGFIVTKNELGDVKQEEYHDYGIGYTIDEDGEELIDDDFPSNVCGLCGYTCTHEKSHTEDRFDYSDDDGLKYKSKNNKVHTVTGMKYRFTECDACHTELEKKKELGKTTEEQRHSYDEGVCWQCKHKNTCKHKKTTKKSNYSGDPDIDTDYYAKDLDDTYHITIGEVWKFTRTICKDCGEELFKKLKISGPSENVKLKHNYINGRCGNCGHIQPPPAPTSVSIAKSATVKLGETLTLTPTLKPANAATTYTWKSAKPAIAKVDANGVVTPVKEGSTKITVTTANKKKATITVKVVDPYKPTKVALSNGKKATVKVGETLQLNAVLTPDSAKTTFKWTSDKKAVASVDGNGLVTAKKAGKAKITVTTANKKKATITITVKK